MGTDKALLEWRGRTILEYIATQVRDAVGNVTIVADPARYAQFGFAMAADQLMWNTQSWQVKARYLSSSSGGSAKEPVTPKKR